MEKKQFFSNKRDVIEHNSTFIVTKFRNVIQYEKKNNSESKENRNDKFISVRPGFLFFHFFYLSSEQRIPIVI